MNWGEPSNDFLVIIQDDKKRVRRIFVSDKSIPKLDEENFRRSLVAEFFKKNWCVKSISKVEDEQF